MYIYRPLQEWRPQQGPLKETACQANSMLRARLWMPPLRLHARARTQICANARTCTRTRTQAQRERERHTQHTHIHTPPCVRQLMHTSTRGQAETHTHAHIHAHIHTHTHTLSLSLLLCLSLSLTQPVKKALMEGMRIARNRGDRRQLRPHALRRSLASYRVRGKKGPFRRQLCPKSALKGGGGHGQGGLRRRVGGRGVGCRGLEEMCPGYGHETATSRLG